MRTSLGDGRVNMIHKISLLFGSMFSVVDLGFAAVMVTRVGDNFELVVDTIGGKGEGPTAILHQSLITSTR